MKKNSVISNFIWRFAERCGARIFALHILLNTGANYRDK